MVEQLSCLGARYGQRDPTIHPFQGRGRDRCSVRSQKRTPMTWNKFKPELFKKMDQRRDWQFRFGTGQVYGFVVACLQQFNQAKQAEAEQALKRIQDHGTFLLVADAFSEFQQIISAATATEPPSVEQPS